MPRLTLLLMLILAVVPAGCDGDASTEAGDLPTALPADTRSTFDPAACGSVTGRVTWEGPVPDPAPFLYGRAKDDGNFEHQLIPNPNRPAVDPTTRAVAGAVVFLRGVDPAAARPWDLPPVRVEMKDLQIRVRQGEAAPGRVGFVRRGDAVQVESGEPVYHILRGRGAAFFSLTLPVDPTPPDRGGPVRRTLDRTGRVELSSGAGYYWAGADLFVDDHPYYTVTGPDGQFELARVPAGKVEVVAWLPGWTVGRVERDPETGLAMRMTYGPPVEVTRPVVVDRGQSTKAALVLAGKQ